ncbi:aromatic amino acid lyase [Streptomyces canus]|uniref:aromatic amino acid lyase n=1 Tax=Streptomyces canus TaxID=58343 RepID=UPI0037DA67C6
MSACVGSWTQASAGCPRICPRTARSLRTAGQDRPGTRRRHPHAVRTLFTDTRHGAAAVEDDSTNGALGARRLMTILVRLGQVLAVEALVAAQAVDLAGPAALGRGPSSCTARSVT